MQNQKISKLQLIYIIMAVSIGTMPYINSKIISFAGRTSWVATNLGALLVIPLALLIIYIGNKSQGNTIFEILEKTLGQFISKIICFIYSLICISITILIIRLLISEIKTFFLPKTPLIVIGLVILSIAVAIILSGIENLGRLLEAIGLVMHLNFLIGVSIGVVNPFFIKNIYPIFVETASSFFNGLYLSFGIASEILLFLMVIVALLPKPSENYKPVVLGSIIASFFLAGIVFSIVGILGCETANNIAFGGLNVAYGIKIGRFLQGMEVFIILSIYLVGLFCITAHMYGTLTAVKQILGSNNHKLLLGIIALLILIIINFISFNQAYLFATYLDRYVTIPFVVIVPIITWVSVIIRARNKIDINN